MLDRLFDFLVLIWDRLWPFFVVKEYNRAVVLRYGRFRRLCGPGLHGKLPFADLVEETTVVPTTLRLGAQSLHTKDNKQIVVESIVKYEVKNAKVLLLEVYDAVAALEDTTQAIIKKILSDCTWQEIIDQDTDQIITLKARTEGAKWGIKVFQVTLTTLSQTDSLRLIGGHVLTSEAP